MKVDDLVRPKGMSLPPMEGDAARFAGLRAALKDADYSEENLRTVLRVDDLPSILQTRLPGHLWHCERSPRAVSVLAGLWLLCQRAPRRVAEEVMGEETVAMLLQRGILHGADGLVEATVDLYPCMGANVLTDRLLAGSTFADHVFCLGGDSYATARLTPRKRVERTLDHCTGSGIHAILAATHSDQVVGVDINPRAVQFATLNAGLNQVGDRCRFVQSDLYQAIGDETFDLIVSNPPWVPTPDVTMQAHRTGGESGEVVTQRIVQGLRHHLRAGGTLSMFVIYPIMRDSTYIERITSWLGGRQGWGIAVATCSETTPETYVSLHIKTSRDFEGYNREYRRWLESYERLGIERIGVGMVYVRRLDPAAAGWAVEKRIEFPVQPRGDLVDSWLDALVRYGDPAWIPDWDGWKPALADTVRLWTEPRSGLGRIESDGREWESPIHLERDETGMLRLLSGSMSTGELTTQWAERRGLQAEPARDEVRRLLRSLGMKNLLK